MGGMGGGLAYHCGDGVTTRAGDGYTGAAVGCVIPALEGEGCAEEVAREGVAGERACSTADIAAVEGGFAGNGGTERYRDGGRGGSGRGGSGGASGGGCSGGGGNRRGGSRRGNNGSGRSAGSFDGSLSGGGLRGGALHDGSSNGLDNSSSLS